MTTFWAMWMCGVLAALVPCASRAADLDAIVRKVQERYDTTRDFTADVTQEMTIASLGKTTTAHGTMAFKRPGKMRWDLTQGDEQVIVADGETLWLYQPKEKQVLKAPFDAAFRATTPISFLTGVGKIAQDFDVSADGEDEKAGVLYLMLVPRRDNASVGKLRLSVARDSGEIRGGEIHDPLGNVSRLRFDHIKRNVGLGDEQFVFQVPPGVDVISAPIGQ
ncbi:MAG TPA: outer membrane lipoprotein chaperone LolA [Candidatus Margulisiibacteriota bacterium]|nr:outer membrane lipoprotein chaperone LolA [Candidatus Margulisiibacteriota bacterium]